VLGVDHRVVRADDRVHVLEEHDALVHRVRPVDLLQFLVVLGEIPRGVEELLRHDRRPQPDVRQGGRSPVSPTAPPRSKYSRIDPQSSSTTTSPSIRPTRPASNVTSFIAPPPFSYPEIYYQKFEWGSGGFPTGPTSEERARRGRSAPKGRAAEWD
jgi:hypothetical protein